MLDIMYPNGIKHDNNTETNHLQQRQSVYVKKLRYIYKNHIKSYEMINYLLGIALFSNIDGFIH